MTIYARLVNQSMSLRCYTFHLPRMIFPTLFIWNFWFNFNEWSNRSQKNAIENGPAMFVHIETKKCSYGVVCVIVDGEREFGFSREHIICMSTLCGKIIMVECKNGRVDNFKCTQEENFIFRVHWEFLLYCYWIKIFFCLTKIYIY